MKEQTPPKERFKPARAGKKRYLLFALESGKSKSELGRELWGAFVRAFGREQSVAMRINLIQFSNNRGIIRCAHNRTGEATTVLNGAGAKTLLASGSLRKLRAKLHKRG